MSRSPNRVLKAVGIALTINLFFVVVSLVSNSSGVILAQSDTTSPTVSSVAVTSDTDDTCATWQTCLDDDGVYGIGDKIEVTVTFSENVTVTGSPRLELDIGGSAKTTNYDSSDGSKVVFSYTVASGDNDADGIAIGSNKLTLNGGSIKDAADNDAVLIHSAVAAQSGHKVDGTRPTITTAPFFVHSTFSNDGVHTVGEEVSFQSRFSEDVIFTASSSFGRPATGTPRLKLNLQSGTKYAYFGWALPDCEDDPDDPFNLCVQSPGPNSRRGTKVTFTYTVASGDQALNGVSIDANAIELNGGAVRDAAGNSAVLTHSSVAAGSGSKIDGGAAPPPPSTDATLSGLTLSGVDFGTFASVTESYTANVAYSVSETTVTPTLNDSDASYVIKLGGTEDADGTVSLAVGSNVITIEVTAEDSTTKKTYTVTVTRAAAATDATLSGLILSGVDFGTFASSTETYTANVAYSVSQTTVTPTLNDSNASSVIKLGGTEDTDGTVSLVVGSNVITVEVTAEDDTTKKTYAVTVTRAAASTDATLSGLALSGVDFGTFASGTESYTAEVTNNPTETTVTPTVNHSGATYVIKIGGVTDADGTVTLERGNNVITVEVTAEDGTTKKTYTVTVTRAAASTDATLSGLALSNVEFGTFASGTESYTASVAYSVSETTVTPTVNDSDATYVIKLGGTEDTDGTVPLAVGSNVITVKVTAEDETTEKTYTVTVTRSAASTDATLSGLAFSGVDFGTFASTTESYTANVANNVSQTTVTPTLNDSDATYIIKLGGTEDTDGTVSLAVGSNVITVEVTAEDGTTKKTYTVNVMRAAPPSSDATLKSLSLSGISFGSYRSVTTSYSVNVANSVTETTVTPAVNHSGATYVIKLDGVEDSDGTSRSQWERTSSPSRSPQRTAAQSRRIRST